MDTWVIGRANEKSRCAIEVMNNIYIKKHMIYVDKEKNGSRIIKEYETIVNGYIVSKKWLQLMRSRNQIKKIKIKIKCKTFLKDKRDMKFIYVCDNSDCKQIITEDSHFIDQEDLLLKKGIKLLNLESCYVMTN